MPTWRTAPDLDDDLTRVWEQLNDEVGEMPSMEAVVGVSAERLARHAMEAVSMLTKMDEADLSDPNFWVRLYALGFVVGCKFRAGQQE